MQPVKPTGIAKSLNIGNPADGPYALDAVRGTGGAMAHVTDDEIRAGIQLLAETTGVFAETAGGVTIAVLKKLVESGAAGPDAGDRHLQHRGRAEDARRRGRNGPAHGNRPADGQGDSGGGTALTARTGDPPRQILAWPNPAGVPSVLGALRALNRSGLACARSSVPARATAA